MTIAFGGMRRRPLLIPWGAELRIPDYAKLERIVLKKSPASASLVHGPTHWQRVALNGERLCLDVPGSDPVVACLFALLHDAMRLRDDDDPDHGRRAAELARTFRLPISSVQLECLAAACAGHADGETSDDPTVGVCWDADRFDLPRVGIEPDVALLSTEAARALTKQLHEPLIYYHGGARGLVPGAELLPRDGLGHQVTADDEFGRTGECG